MAKDNDHDQVINKHQDLLQDMHGKLTEVHTSVTQHADRLSRIEDAIIQLAATQERVKALESRIQSVFDAHQLLSKEVWDEFKESRENYMDCIDERASTNQKVKASEARLKNLEKFEDEFNKEHSKEIAGNSKFRKMAEKIFIGVAIFALVAAGAAVIKLNGPSPLEKRFERIEILILSQMTTDGKEFDVEEMLEKLKKNEDHREEVR